MKRNICIITQRLYGGGAERAAANLSNDLSEDNNVYIVAYDGERVDFPYKGTLIDCSTKPNNTRLGQILNFIKRLLMLRKVKKQFNIDISISFLRMANFLNVLSRHKDKVIISVRNMMSLSNNSRLDNFIISWCGKKADMTVSLSKGVEKDLIANYQYTPDKVTTIYNSCNFDIFYSESDELDSLTNLIENSSHVLVSAGRLEKQKGQWHQIRAMSIVTQTHPNCKLIIFGEGSLHEGLKKYAEKLGVENNVLFPGYVNKYHSLMKKCDVFIFSSLFEGLGNVILEAIACGMPVISCDCEYGPKEILSSEDIEVKDVTYSDYGVLYPAFTQKEFDVEDLDFEQSDYYLADSILSVIDNKDIILRYKALARERAKYFTSDYIKSQWMQLFDYLDCTE